MKWLRYREGFWLRTLLKIVFQIQRVCKKDFERDFEKYKFEVEEIHG